MRHWFFIIYGLTLPHILWASTNYNWQSCVEITQKNNPELAIALERIRSSEFQKKAARSPFIPALSASVGYTKRDDDSDSHTAALNASVNLFSGLKDYSRLSQSEASLEVANAQYIKSAATILYQLRSAFEDYLYAKESHQLSREIAKRREENLKIVRLRYQGGLENKGSVLLSEAYLAQAQYEALQASNALMTARSKLAQVMGLDRDDDFDISERADLIAPPDAVDNFAELVKATPEYLEALAQEDYAASEVSIAKSNFSPSLNLTGSLSQNGDEFMRKQNQQASVGLMLTIPLFDGGKDYYGHRVAVANHTTQKLTRIHLMRTMSTELKSKYVTFVESVAKLKAAGLFKEAVEVRAKIAKNKYNNGLLTFENWDIIENDLISRQKAYLQSLRERALAQAAWDQILGRGLE